MSKHRQKTTIYDIAKAAQTSAPTVSLVLGGSWRRYRVSEDTAARVLAKAAELGYSANLRARGLRLSRSGLAGMILPHYRNRFFAGLAEHFEIEARRRGLCPVVVSTQREAATELATAETLVAHQVEFLFVAGVKDPVEINRLCANEQIRSVNIDLPGDEAPSAISDNQTAARQLTDILLDRLDANGPPDFAFFGGDEQDNSTIERMAGVRDAFNARGMSTESLFFDCCGYQPAHIASVVCDFHVARGGVMPAAVFANGITALEGLLEAEGLLGRELMRSSVIGCYDWDPFAASLPLGITFVRQDVEALIKAGFSLLEDSVEGERDTVRIPAEIRCGRASAD
ncbi:LacI family DNA-binding transcriptional regulator [Paracoccus versutus]